jgi:hypothetical protein
MESLDTINEDQRRILNDYQVSKKKSRTEKSFFLTHVFHLVSYSF